jgi:antitoxin MazE
MKSRIVQIGSSRGARLPKALLDEARLVDEIELQAAPGRIVVRKANRARAGLGRCGSTHAQTQ